MCDREGIIKVDNAAINMQCIITNDDEELTNMNIRTKLILSFTAMIALLLALALFTYHYMKQSQFAQEATLDIAQSRYFLKTVQYLLTGMSNDERAYLLNPDEHYASEIKEKNKQLQELLEGMPPSSMLDASERALLVEIKQKYNSYWAASQLVFSKMKNGQPDAAAATHFGTEADARKLLDDNTALLLAKLDQKIDTNLKNSRQENDRQKLLMVIIFTVGLFFAALIGLVLARAITKPLKQVEGQMKEIADGYGDLSRELVVRSKDELGMLAASFNRMVGNLRSILSHAQETAIQVAASSQQLTASAEQTTRATEQIVEATNHIMLNTEKEQQYVTAAVQAIHHISEGIHQVSKGNEEISRLVTSASDTSGQGVEAVRSVLSEMKEVHETVRSAAVVIESLGNRSQQINGIARMITDLAEQTNLLSLNAGIEAARAGEHGKGFAVVAQEIRKLAEQSRQSAAQITVLIDEIVAETQQAVSAMHAGTGKVDTGLSKAELVDDVFRSIESSIAAVTLQVHQTAKTAQQLAASSREVVAMIEGVSAASQEVAASCDNNAASTEEQLAVMEEISSSSQVLSKLAENLNEVLSRFKLH